MKKLFLAIDNQLGFNTYSLTDDNNKDVSWESIGIDWYWDNTAIVDVFGDMQKDEIRTAMINGYEIEAVRY